MTQGEMPGSTSDYGGTADSSNTSVVSVAPMASSKIVLHGHLWTLHLGRLGMLASHKPSLLQFVFEFCKQGIQVTTRMIRKFAETVVPDFQKDSPGIK